MLRLLSPRRAAVVVGVLGLALLGAACTSNDTGTDAAQTPAARPATAAPASEPFGAACSAVPASGPGSVTSIAGQPVATAASNQPALSTLVTAANKANLVSTLNSAERITVFAPTDDAFAALPKATLDKALGDPKGLLTTVLTYHVVDGQLTPEQLAGTHKTLQGDTIEVTGSGENFKVNGQSSIVCGNVKTANATVYLIDQVLLPNS